MGELGDLGVKRVNEQIADKMEGSIQEIGNKVPPKNLYFGHPF